MTDNEKQSPHKTGATMAWNPLEEECSVCGDMNMEVETSAMDGCHDGDRIRCKTCGASGNASLSSDEDSMNYYTHSAIERIKELEALVEKLGKDLLNATKRIVELRMNENNVKETGYGSNR